MDEKVKSEGGITPPKVADQRKARLAAALRDNLRKRKERARAGASGEQPALVPPDTKPKPRS